MIDFFNYHNMFDLIKIKSIHHLPRYNDFGRKNEKNRLCNAEIHDIIASVFYFYFFGLLVIT